MTAWQMGLLVAGFYLGLSVLVTGCWCAMSWFCGTRACNRPAIVAARQAEEVRRRHFVMSHMSRYPA